MFNLKPVFQSIFGMGLAVMLLLPLSGVPVLAQGPESVAKLAAQLSPAVVNIGSSRRVDGGPGMPFPEFPDGSPLEDLFDPLNPNHDEGDALELEARSLGSGFLISADGLLVTNNHVIAGAGEILVFLSDGTRLVATVVGTDELTDLAVLRINAGRELPFVEFGDSDSAEVGDWVMAIGNPFGLGGSVTLGIVSARNRDINTGPYDSFIQTDASINQGNSGGPLFDMNGKVVGINTALIARGGAALGIGFAVSGNLAKPVIEQLSIYGETRRGWLGVGIQEVTEDIAASLGRSNTRGAMVTDITPDGPADGALLEGDLILSFDGKPVERMRDLPRIVAETEVGRTVSVQVLRRDKLVNLTLELGRLESPASSGTQEAAPGGPIPPLDIPGAAPSLIDLVGFETVVLDADARAAFGIDENVSGVLVNKVVPYSDADEKGLTRGLVITKVNQQDVSSVDDVNTIVSTASEAGRKAVLFKVSDMAGTSRFIAVKLGTPGAEP